MKNIAIMASGSGTNAENIIRFFRTNPEIKVRLVLTNKADAYVLDRAHSFKIETMREGLDFYKPTKDFSP